MNRPVLATRPVKAIVLMVAAASVAVVTVRFGAGVLAVVAASALVAAAAAPRVASKRPSLVSADRVLTAQIITLPIIIGMARISPPLIALLLFTQALIAAMRLRPRAFGDRRILFLIALTAVTLLVIGTGAIVAAVAAIATLMVVLATATSGLNRVAVNRAVATSIEVFLGANVGAYYLLGFDGAATSGRIAGYESSIGLLASRVSFPFTASMVMPSVFAAAYLCWSIPALRRRDGSQLRWLVGTAMAAFVLIATDYRIPMAFALVIVITQIVWPRAARFAGVPIALAGLALPLWWNRGENGATELAAVVGLGGTLESFGRGGEGFATLSNRTVIWDVCVRAYADGALINHLFGWGFAGQVGSGAANHLNALTRGFVATNATSAHSSLLQSLLDGGLILTSLLVALILWGVKRSEMENCADQRPVLASARLPLLAMVFCGATEVTLVPGLGQEAYWLFLLLAGVNMVQRDRPAKPAEPGSALPAAHLARR